MSVGGLLGGSGGIGGMIGGAIGGPIGAMIGQLVEKVVGQVLNQVMDQVSKELGVSDSAKDCAKKSVSDKLGSDGDSIDEALDAFQKETGASDSDMGNVKREIEELKQKFMDGFKKLSEENKADKKGSKGGDKDDWFMAIAKALAEAAGDQANKIADKSAELTGAREAAEGMDSKDPAKGDADKKIMQLQTELQAESSKMGFLMQAVNASINSLGEALKTAAQVK
jgi:predicted  nucleic acid-binding Zn-ribbon protein